MIVISFTTWIYNYNVPVKSVPIPTNIVSSNLAHSEVYSI
jgi:hypothetical protein